MSAAPLPLPSDHDGRVSPLLSQNTASLPWWYRRTRRPSLARARDRPACHKSPQPSTCALDAPHRPVLCFLSRPSHAAPLSRPGLPLTAQRRHRRGGNSNGECRCRPGEATVLTSGHEAFRWIQRRLICDRGVVLCDLGHMGELVCTYAHPIVFE